MSTVETEMSRWAWLSCVPGFSLVFGRRMQTKDLTKKERERSKICQSKRTGVALKVVWM